MSKYKNREYKNYYRNNNIRRESYTMLRRKIANLNTLKYSRCLCINEILIRIVFIAILKYGI